MHLAAHLVAAQKTVNPYGNMENRPLYTREWSKSKFSLPCPVVNGDGLNPMLCLAVWKRGAPSPTCGATRLPRDSELK